MELDEHKFLGMQRDVHPINQRPEFLWEAHNVRLSRLGSSTMFSIVNEKGTKDTNISYQGNYVGHCIVGNYLVVFTVLTVEGIDKSYIYRTSKDDLGNLINITLIDGAENLLQSDTLILTLPHIELQLIQKVYWVDGVNVPRMIIITKPELEEVNVENGQSYDYLWDNKNTLDFIPKLRLAEKVKVTRNFGSGHFKPGIIQYAFTYYTKYGSESAIVYTTPILYISELSRGESPEETVGCWFNIKVSNLDNFEYIRTYSIHRTSINSTPEVKIVSDIHIEKGQSEITIIDTGETGSSIDPFQVLYLGGETIIPDCISSSKDTLFLGNLKYKKNSKEIYYTHESGLSKETIYNYIDRLIRERTENISLPYTTSTDTYKHASQLLASTQTFKSGEWYRFGILYLYEDGHWTEPHFIELHTISDIIVYPLYNSIQENIQGGYSTLTLVRPYLTLLHLAIKGLKQSGYKRIRGVVVYPEPKDRKVLAQGVLCPTVFSIENRVNNRPYAQSSWFFRPYLRKYPSKYYIGDLKNEGSSIEYRHLHCLYPYDSGVESGQVTPRSEIFGSDNKEFLEESKNYRKYRNKASSPNYYVDSSIVTFHSPDIEFGDLNILENANYYIKIPKVINIDAWQAQSKTNATAPALTMLGTSNVTDGAINLRISKTFTGEESNNSSNNGLYTNVLYADRTILNTEADNMGEFETSSFFNKFLICPWQKSGSLNNDVIRPEGKGVLTAVLKNKILVNCKYSASSKRIRKFGGASNLPLSYKVGGLEVFDGLANQIVLKTINNKLYDRCNYQGNVDTLLTSDTYNNVGGFLNYGTLVLREATSTIDENIKYAAHSPEIDIDSSGIPIKHYPVNTGMTVRMKYKSTPHAVINLSSDLGEWILPTLVQEELYDASIIPFWMSESWSSGTVDPWKLFNFGEVYTLKKIKFILYNDSRPTDYNFYKLFPLGTTVQAGEFAILFVNKQNVGQVGYLYLAANGSNDGTTWVSLDETYLKELGQNYTFGYMTQHVPSDNPNAIMYVLNTYQVVGDYSPWMGGYFYHIKECEDSPKLYLHNVGKVIQQDIATDYSYSDENRSYMFIGELVREELDIKLPFGGDTEEALKNNKWYPATDVINLEELDEDSSVELVYKYGDTWCQRYDCLKTYPYTNEDENQIIDILSFNCESRVNLDGRYDRNRGLIDALYVSPLNFNLLNNVYSLKDTIFTYRILDDDFYKITNFPLSLIWSLEKLPGAEIDSWCNLLESSILNLDGQYGDMHYIYANNDLFVFLEDAISKVYFKSRVQIPTSDGVPIQLLNSNKVEGYDIYKQEVGILDKNSIIATEEGVYFLDKKRDSFYLFSDRLHNLSLKFGMSNWIALNTHKCKWTVNKKDLNGTKLFHDVINKDIYLSVGKLTNDTDTSLCFNYALGLFTSTLNYGGICGLLSFNGDTVSLLLSDSLVKLWKNFEGEYNSFYGEYKPFYISFVSNKNPNINKIFDTIEYTSDAYINNELIHENTFNYIKVDNEYQNTSIRRTADITNKWNPIKKFRIWRGQIPRDLCNLPEGKRAKTRISNPWTKITLGYDKLDNTLIILHDVSVKYTI